MRKPGIIQISCEGNISVKTSFLLFFYYYSFIIDLMNLFEEAVWFLIFGL